MPQTAHFVSPAGNRWSAMADIILWVVVNRVKPRRGSILRESSDPRHAEIKHPPPKMEEGAKLSAWNKGSHAVASIEINPEDRIQLYEWHRLWGQEAGHMGLIEGPEPLTGNRTFHQLPEEFLDYLRKRQFPFKRLDAAGPDKANQVTAHQPQGKPLESSREAVDAGYEAGAELRKNGARPDL
jgi:hypothetical protein